MPDTPATLLTKAYRYLGTHTAGWPDDHLRAVLRQPPIQQAARAIDAAASAGDSTATAQACRQYWQQVLAQTPKETL